MGNKRWTFDAESGGVTIPEDKRREVKARLEQFAEQNYAGQYVRLDIRFRGKFCYVDAYTEPHLSAGWPPDDWPETREEMIERLRNTPVHLCRLRYFGGDKWGFAFFTYSNEKYTFSIFPDGSSTGIPEDAFEASAVYLQG